MKARIFNFLVTLVVVGLAAWAAWVLYERYINDPWTRDSQVLNSEANLKQRQQDLDRQSQLYRNHVVAQQDFQNAQDNFSAAQAELISARANLELARLNLSYTKVFAPVNGYVTNLITSEGTYVTAGKQLIALVDGSSFWIAAYFKETQVPHIQIGQKANLALMGYR